MSDVNLSKAVRSNLLSLQSTAANMAKTQERLATGLKVNSALDNPTNFFTAASLNSRAGDMGNLLELDVERYQDHRSSRQRPDLDHQDRRNHAVDLAPGPAGQVVPHRVVRNRHGS